MHPAILLSLSILLGFSPLQTNHSEDSLSEYRVYTDHPRLFLRPQRLRLLKRERERQSVRWQQFEVLMAGNAQMPEPGLANALYHQVTGDPAFAKKAIEFAATAGADLRQTALVFDWCQDALTESQREGLILKLKTGIERARNANDMATVRSRTLAAVALGDHLATLPETTLQRTFQTWWKGNAAPAIKQGDSKVFSRADAYALFELLHAVRDNLNIEMREQAGAFFKELPAVLLLSYYPLTYPSPENHFRVPMFPGSGEPDLKTAALSRAAEFSMVAYDTNAQENQFLQGWLMQDRFIMQGPYGAPYEFLWANPYQPGLSYFHMPLYAHDTRFGRLFLRSSWEEDAQWLGYADGRMQSVTDGKIKEWKLKPSPEPVTVGDAAAVLPASASNEELRFAVTEKSPLHYFIVGLKPGAAYQVEVDDEEMFETATDRGGILAIDFAKPSTRGVRLRPVAARSGP